MCEVRRCAARRVEIHLLFQDFRDRIRPATSPTPLPDSRASTWVPRAISRWSSTTRSTSIVLDTPGKLDPKNSLAPNTVRWLMGARKADRWKTTQENAWAIMALTDWMAVTGELEVGLLLAGDD